MHSYNPGLESNVLWDGVIERRHEERSQADSDALLRIINPARDERWNASVRDFSNGGLKLLTTEFLAPGTLVLVKIEAGRAFGEVRYCIETDDGFLAGIQVQSWD